ncbi:hypothetical protein [Nisaea sp.]|uniref:hypothetical protein n=1 Tax=Nisaea sp. TaxID=2024842 RepID=UPI0032EEFE0B
MTAAEEEGALDPSTHFAFEHRIFKVNGAHFMLSGQDRTAALRVKVGDLEASVPLESLCTEFGIDEDSQDGKLLVTVRKGLNYVKDIRPGDTIPRELLDGSASWSIEEKHLERAKNRLMAQIAKWVSGEDVFMPGEADIQAEMAKPETKERIQKGIADIAEKLGLGADRKQEVIDLVDRVARELAYIEALRDRFTHAGAIQNKLLQVAALHRGDRQFVSEVQRVRTLMEPPIRDFSFIFDQVDAQTGEILTVLKSYDKQINFIREMRDELHKKIMIWDEVIETWEIDLSSRSKGIREAVQSTYRFVAYNFPQAQDWM